MTIDLEQGKSSEGETQHWLGNYSSPNKSSTRKDQKWPSILDDYVEVLKTTIPSHFDQAPSKTLSPL